MLNSAMASKMRLLSGRLPRVSVCYNGGFPALNSAIQQRGYSDQSNGNVNRNHPVVVYEAHQEPESEIYTKTFDDKFGEQFRHFPLPGNMTTIQHFRQIKAQGAISTPKTASGIEQSDIMTSPTTHDRQIYQLHVFSEISKKMPPTEIALQQNLGSQKLEFTAHVCPDLVRKHFADLFPNRDIQKGLLTVMTLTQRTKTDMSEWSGEVDQERDEMISQFVSTASAICESLQKEGFWADFIDPTSGRPYLGPFTNATLFETDDRYHHFGFSIEDLGCCKVIRHQNWGTHVFVGSVFTDSPLDATILQKLLPQRHVVTELPPSFDHKPDEFEEILNKNMAIHGPDGKEKLELVNDSDPSPVNRKIKNTGEATRALKIDDKC